MANCLLNSPEKCVRRLYSHYIDSKKSENDKINNNLSFSVVKQSCKDNSEN